MILLLVLVAAWCVALGSTLGALATWNKPFPSLVLDPFGCFSAVALPSWQTERFHLRFPDRVVAVDDLPVTSAHHDEVLPAREVDARIDAAARAGRTSAILTFVCDGSPRRVVCPLRRFGSAEIAFLWGLYTLIALFVLWSGVAVQLLAGTREGARAYTFWSWGAFLFFASFYDYHTTHRLLPVFALSVPWLAGGFFWLALAFPERPRRGARPQRVIAALGSALLALAGVVLALAPSLGWEVFVLRVVVNQLVLVGMTALALSIVLRLRQSDGRDREELRIALWGLGGVPFVLVVGFILTETTGSAAVHFILPLVTLGIPLSIGWALVRHNILGTHAVLGRRLLVIPVALVALGGALLVWLALRNDSARPMESLVPVLAACGAFAAIVATVTRFLDRVLFPAKAAFRPTIEQLAESLADVNHRDDLRGVLERTIRQWLPSGRVRLLAPGDLDEIDHLPADALGRLDAGQKVWTDASPWERHLLVPARSLGVLRAVIDIAPKHQGALFTDEDLALLDTIAALGAIALHNAEILATLESNLRVELDATREDKRLTLGLLGAELSHEIAHPLKFFQGLLRRGAKRPIDTEDVQAGEEEIARLDRMLARMRTLESPPPRSVTVSLAEPVARAAMLVREALADKNVACTVELPPGCEVVADPDGLVQVFANLLRNAVQAVAPRGHVGVRAAPDDAGALVIDVWDDGPGVPEDRAAKLFYAWVTSRAEEGGAGLGLSVAQELVKAFEWEIKYVREEGRTCFRVTVPREKVARARAGRTEERSGHARSHR